MGILCFINVFEKENKKWDNSRKKESEPERCPDCGSKYHTTHPSTGDFDDPTIKK